MNQPSSQNHLEYFRELRPHVNTASILLAVGIIGGFLLGAFSPFPQSQVMEPLGGAVQLLLGLPKSFLALGIFVNNGLKTFLVIVLGVLFGVVPVVFVLANGFAIGFLLHLSTKSTGLIASLFAIVPHGIFELPGVLLGASIGLMVGTRAIKRVFGKSQGSLAHELRRGLRFFWQVIIPLLLVGALVEAFITSALISL